MKKKSETKVILKAHLGDNITDTIKKAIKMADFRATVAECDKTTKMSVAFAEYAGNIAGVAPMEDYRNVEFDFNGVTVVVKHDSDPTLVCRDWRRALSGYIDKTVGPDYKAELSPEELASDAKIEAKNEARRAKQDAKWQAEADEKRARFDARLAQAPEMSFSDKAGWDEWLANQGDDGCGKTAFRYAEWWARLMELEIGNGKQIAEVANETSHEADVGGITGSMYGVAVSALAQYWKYGEELRRWHNIKTQLKNEGEKANEEGGVLSPTMLTIG